MSCSVQSVINFYYLHLDDLNNKYAQLNTGLKTFKTLKWL